MVQIEILRNLGLNEQGLMILKKYLDSSTTQQGLCARRSDETSTQHSINVEWCFVIAQCHENTAFLTLARRASQNVPNHQPFFQLNNGFAEENPCRFRMESSCISPGTVMPKKIGNVIIRQSSALL